MNIQKSFTHLRPLLQKRVMVVLARGSGVRENFEDQLTRFFELLEQALVSGDADWMDPLLQEWSRTRTETDLEGGEHNVTALLKQIVTLTLDGARETLGPEEALELVSALMPIYLHGIERVLTYENESRTAYLTTELEQMKRNEARLDQSKTNFVAVAAHELKTPLTLIEGYTTMIGELLPRNMENVHTLVQGVYHGIHRLSALVNDMLDMSLIDNNLLTLNIQPVWLNQTIKMLEAELAPTLQQRRQTLAVQAFNGLEEMLFADPARLQQALRNILINAIKFTPDGGAITIAGRLLPGFVEVTISDTGIGIPLENQDSIFEKFGQLGDVALHSSGKTKFKGGGPGMGLPIAKGIIEAHGGSLWAESPGYDELTCPGSTFHALLPLRRPPDNPGLAQLFESL